MYKHHQISALRGKLFHVRIPVKLHIELDVPIGGLASPSDTGNWLLSGLDPSPDR
jgi:hypothetical protein